MITPLRFVGGDGEGVSILYACSPCSVTSVGETPNVLLCVLTVTVESPMCFSCFYEKPWQITMEEYLIDEGDINENRIYN